MKLCTILLIAIMAATSFAAGNIPAPEVTSTHTRHAQHIPAPEVTRTHTRPAQPAVTTFLVSSASSSFVTSKKAVVTARQEEESVTSTFSSLPRGTAHGGALDPTPEFTSLANIATPTQGPASVTISITNRAGVDLRLLIDTSITATLPNNQATGIPRGGGWHGRVAFQEVGRNFLGDESLIEASYAIQPDVAGGQYPIFDINVSYVDGFTLPITCRCRNPDVYLTGCDVNLWNRAACPAELRTQHEACRNPKRASNDPAETPHAFFAPCANLAYTFPWDHVANSNGECQYGIAECIIHSASPKIPTSSTD